MNKEIRLIEIVIITLLAGRILAIAIPNMKELNASMDEEGMISCIHKYECVRCGEKI